MAMIRTNFYLPRGLLERLAKASTEQNTPQGVLLRIALDQYLVKTESDGLLERGILLKGSQ